MSILIKGIDVPKTCADCQFEVIDISGYPRCVIMQEMVVDGNLFNRCPLTEISTPHGRLIDADKLKEKRETMCWKDEFYMTHESDFIDSRHIDNAPTILEAEE